MRAKLHSKTAMQQRLRRRRTYVDDNHAVRRRDVWALGPGRRGLAHRCSPRQRIVRSCAGGRATRIIERLRERVDATLYRHVARMCEQAVSGLQGVGPYRSTPPSMQDAVAALPIQMITDTPECEPLDRQYPGLAHATNGERWPLGCAHGCQVRGVAWPAQ